jgi:hypothetical protein
VSSQSFLTQKACTDEERKVSHYLDMSELPHDPEYQKQRELLEELMAPQPVVIGLEGGPCSGKTTLTNEIAAQAERLDRPFVALPEAATHHIEKVMAEGKTIPELAAHDRPGYLEFQRDVLRTIVTNIERAKTVHAGTNAILLIDRPDIGAYVTPDEYRQVLDELGYAKAPIHALVDKLVFLPSVASEQPALYADLRTTNRARYETSADEAAAVCAANLRAVQTHPELEVAWGGEFTEKIKHLAAMVLQPELEGEIKQGVPNADAEAFIRKAIQNGNLLNILTIGQSYHDLGGQEFRLRQSSGDDGGMHYYLTIKTGEGAFRHELQRALAEDEYELLQRAKRIGNALLKLRHVVLDDADESGRRRLWFADRYIEPELPEWHFETEVKDDTELEELTARYGTARRRVTESAKALIFK